MSPRSPFGWIINHFNYLQTFIFICTLFFLSLIPIEYFWIKTHLDSINLIDEQLAELKEEKALQNLFKDMQQHRLLAQRLQLTSEQEFEADMQKLDDQIRMSLKQFMDIYQPKGDYYYEPSIWQNMNPLNVQTRWDSMMQQMQHLPKDKIEPFYTSIIHDLLIQFSYLSDKVGVSYFKEIQNYSFIERIFLRLPSLQENVAQLVLLGERRLLNTEKKFSSERMTTLINFVESDLAYLKFKENFEEYNLDPILLTLHKSLNVYRNSIEVLIRIINTHLVNVDPPTISLSQFQSYSELAIKNGFALWDNGFEELEYVFKIEKEQITYRLWFVLFITLFLTGFALILGLVLTLSGISRLSQLTEATDSFTNGNLSIRIPDKNQDEIGRQAQAFNRMAQKLEEIINHLYELLEATKALSNGNLTARIQTRKNDTEFDQVAQSFNNMAETFETIIGRLQQIGTMLTASASEIAGSSKEQEIVIVEQEATTREIAVAANEISSTAKEFAVTMNEMSKVAEQTSDLALTGKGSLNNMEFIMSQMVEASTNIASKLAILNEKAGNITGVITTITKVADQTNLLSLNASIEAEKAGEFGRSFAVIAREIRRLADQTAIATLDIEKIVNEIMTAVSTSVMGVDDFTQEIRNGVEQVRTVSGQLAKIIEQVQAFTGRFELLNQGMQAQSTGAEQINEAISQLSLTAQQTSRAIHQFHKTVQELNHAASELRILTPFTRSDIQGEFLTKKDTSDKEHTLFQPITKESTKQFKKTLSNLHIATSKLKNLNIQLRPPFKHPP